MASLTLYGYYRSSCSARLRIALDLKAIEYKPVYINLNKGEHHKDEYGARNPSRSVPTLMVNDSWCIPQSMAALEYLEEAYTQATTLLPADAKARADVRALAEIIAIDTQPPTNSTTMKQAESSGADQLEWTRFFARRGLKAFETMVSKTAGRYCCGDKITLADVCLVPALWNAERFGVAIETYPTISRVYGVLREHPSFTKSHWQNQPDCPEELR
ncbi:hypothetical protein QM012_003386 [Aureobasidium pullulans]|uniref:Maleylacetoacetate isomerase n=1 Tax=Aureobasidium pullulans TaxID=5580 RepID=A0ABR0T896_AURPU